MSEEDVRFNPSFQVQVHSQTQVYIFVAMLKKKGTSYSQLST